MTHKKNYKIRIISIIISVIFLIGVLPIAVSAASCENCGEDSDYTVEYEYWTETYHTIRHWCDNCGKDQNMGGAADRHSFSHYNNGYDICDDCGYEIDCECGEGDSECYHDNTYTEWDDCDWYKYCEDCGEEIDSGTEHGETDYKDWVYYSTTRHRRFVYCVDCHVGEYEYARHDSSTEYYSYDDYEHEIVDYCADCDEYLSDPEYEEHTFYYSSWKDYDDDKHRRRIRCEYCDYLEYEYESHTFTSGSYTVVSEKQHRFDRECDCGCVMTQTGPHSYVTGYLSGDGEVHIVTNECECGYCFEEPEAHLDNDSDGACDICGTVTETSRFSVTLPAVLTLTVSEDGTVYAAVSATIANNSTEDITVTDITLNAENGWTIVPFDTDMANEKVNTKLIGFRINGSESTIDGDSEDLTLNDEWNIPVDDVLTLDYEVVVSAISEPVDEQVLTVVFIIGWAK